jgi:diguanylate cyclase (GGDEF)-like protein
MQSTVKNNTRIFLSTDLASRSETRFALAAALVSVVIIVVVAPFAKTQLTQIIGFIPAYQSALIVCDLITSVMLFSLFNNLRSRALFVLACGYLFNAFMAFSQLLSFPGVFSATGLFGAEYQSAPWLYLFWHGGFPLFVILYALLKDQGREAAVTSETAGSPRYPANIVILAGVAAVLSIACGLTFIATGNHVTLPMLLLVDHKTLVFDVVVTSLWILCLFALVILYRRRPHTVLDLWLMVAMCAWLSDIALASILNAGRFDLGWYGGRLYGLASASFVLIVLLIESGKHYVRLTQLSAELSAANDSLEQLSLHDGLTDLANRRYFDKYLATQIAIARRYKRSLALVICDVDHFKAYNDHYGHQAGDECLKQVAAALRSWCRRPADLAARYGGEEFAMILPDTDLTGAAHIAEAAREAIAQLGIPHEHSTTAPYVSISGGFAALLGKVDITAEQLISAADQSLYQAKHLGRNRMVSVPPEPVTSTKSAIPFPRRKVV